ncbi:MAG TPA: DEAD/DEAH box helicase family protein [Anaerolineales bacterium]|nr:DEAD/DEAH box helicase family protein [Anaerolineales bacterium]
MQLKNYQQRSLSVLARYFQACLQSGDADLAFYNLTRQLFGQGIPYHPVAELPGLPYVCLRVPTGGGKTLMACHAVRLALREHQRVDHGLVLWLAPSKTIREQTINALKDPKHPYRQALDSELGSVSVLDLSEAQYLQPATLNTDTVIIVSTTQAFRVEDPELRKVYETSGALMSHFDSISLTADVERYENGKPTPSLANLLRLHRPIVIVDEAHNVRSDISFMTLARFNPSCILEFTATPKSGSRASNVLYTISARELKAEAMIKLPIRLEVRPQWKELIGDAITALKGLEHLAEIERAKTGEYLRPIMLLQAQPRRQGQQTLTVEVVEYCLKNDYGIPPEQIKRATGEDNQIEGLDLLAPGDVRYIITVQALREGWDCPFAYVLCSVAEQHGATAVEQIVGRVLRMPKATRKGAPELNMAYAFVASNNFAQALARLKDALLENGFQKQEVDEMMAATPPQPDLGLLFSYRAAGGQSITLKVSESPELYKVPAELANAVSYDAQTQTLEMPANLTSEQVAALAPAFSTPSARQAFIAGVQAGQARLAPPDATPAERGEVLAVPRLAWRQGKLLEPFEETHFLDFDWELSKQDAALSESEFSAVRPAAQQAEVDISEEGKLRTEFLSNLQDQMTLLKVDLGWKASDLVYWLDRNILHRDITPTEAGIFLTRLVTNLIEKRGLSLDTLVREKYRLRDAAAAKIDAHRKQAHALSFSQLLKEGSPLEVSPDLVFTYDPEEYPAPVNSLYKGMHQFKKHYYPDVGDLKSAGEEHECAQIIDSLDEVDCWVRNLDSQPARSFWLQTSAGRFYPDFVCKLNDGRILVVEYKGSHLYTDAEEKRIIGELWEKRSQGKCLFVMPTERKFDGLRAKIQKGLW